MGKGKKIKNLQTTKGTRKDASNKAFELAKHIVKARKGGKAKNLSVRVESNKDEHTIWLIEE